MDDGELERARLAVEQTPAEDPRRSRRIRDLGALWRRRFLADGDITELDRAIGYFRGALGRAGTALPATEYNLAVLFSDRYDILGDAADLAAAIEAVQRGLEFPVGRLRRPARLPGDACGAPMGARHATGVLTDLERAIEVAAEAVAGTAPDAPLGPRLNSNLGMMYLDRHERTGDAADPDQGDRARGTRRGRGATRRSGAARVSQQPGQRAAPAIRAGDPRFVAVVNRCPTTSSTSATWTPAIQLYRAALSDPADGPKEVERAMISSNLGDALLDRAAIHELVDERDQAGMVYGQALAAHEEAVAVTPPTAPDRPGQAEQASGGPACASGRTSAQADIDAARASFREACQTGLLAAPRWRWPPPANWLTWEVDRKDWWHAVVADGYALRAADGLHRTQQRRADRETWLLESRGLAAEAAYATVRDGDLRAAVARMERARAILLADDLDLGVGRAIQPSRSGPRETVRRGRPAGAAAAGAVTESGFDDHGLQNPDAGELRASTV